MNMGATILSPEPEFALSTSVTIDHNVMNGPTEAGLEAENDAGKEMRCRTGLYRGLRAWRLVSVS